MVETQSSWSQLKLTDIIHRLILIHILCQIEMLDKFFLSKVVHLCSEEAFYMVYTIEETIEENESWFKCFIQIYQILKI